mgnify:FL=1|tara:strand:- start:238 stop:468 length:231 start_codon:yes stop_codon:yes gene_type:complete
MSKEEMNEELSTDDLKDVAGGPHYTTYGGTSFTHGKQVKGFKTGEGGDSFNQQQNALRNEKKKGKKDSFTWEAASD